MIKNPWVKELARDIISLGGLPFLLLTTIRVSVLAPYYPMQFIFSSGVFFLLMALFKAELHAGVGLILLVFISLYYKYAPFTVFALLVYAGIIVSLFYLGTERSRITKGILLGAVSAWTGHHIVALLFF